MAKTLNPRKTRRYSLEFKLKAVLISLRDDFQVQVVAEALDIHPFMLSRWRKEYREGTLVSAKRKTPAAPKLKAAKELTEVEKLRKQIAQLKQENDLLKKWQRFLAEQRRNGSSS
jgi:transposase